MPCFCRPWNIDVVVFTHRKLALVNLPWVSFSLFHVGRKTMRTESRKLKALWIILSKSSSKKSYQVHGLTYLFPHWLLLSFLKNQINSSFCWSRKLRTDFVTWKSSRKYFKRQRKMYLFLFDLLGYRDKRWVPQFSSAGYWESIFKVVPLTGGREPVI